MQKVYTVYPDRNPVWRKCTGRSWGKKLRNGGGRVYLSYMAVEAVEAGADFAQVEEAPERSAISCL